jgi:23S rRNA (uracil1939-C5)-methyltransferase
MMEPVRILRLAAGGDGVGKLADGRAVFVPRSAPGDLVTLRNIRRSSRFARARIERVLEPGPDRVEPRCPHYTVDDCGGCQLQHLTPAAQLRARRAIVGDALRRLARLDISDPEIEPAPQQFGYRTKLTLAAGADRRRLGLHPIDQAQAVFDLARCHITADPLMELWEALRPLRTLLPVGLEQVVLRLDRGGERHLLAKVAGSRVWTRAGELAELLTGQGTPAVLWWQPEGGVARVVAGRSSRRLPGSVFEQVHPAMGDRVRAYAVEQLGSVTGRRAWDLYAGIGETTAALARAGAQVESVERDPKAVAHADAAGPAARRHAGEAEALVGQLGPAELVITNPPRGGMDSAVTAALADRGFERIVYVSCDPATLARDIVRLGPGFRLTHVRAFDLFPQTAHVETVAVLEPV